MGQTADQFTDLLRYARNASPKGLRAAVFPVVRRVLPAEIRAKVRREWSIANADRWVDNRYTISEYGVKRHFFFLCGCFKSGTHWVQNLLNLHPHIHVQGEYHFEVAKGGVDHLTNVYWFLGSRPDLREAAIDGFESMVRRVIYAGARGQDAALWLGDRTPNPLTTIIRGAPQIMITRDVRDVLVSWSFHHLRVESELGIHPDFREKWKGIAARFQSDPDNFDPLDGFLGDEAWVRCHARQWTQIWRASRRAMPTLREEGSRILELSYERMHADLPAELDRMYRFLGLDPALAAAPSAETRTLPGFKKEDRRSFYRRGEVGEWKRVLPDRIRDIIKEEAGAEMIAAGYEKDLNW
ncbi:MAG: sulfotransferase domain-containing protein [Phycisphaerales bacterium]|nr:sulfotransferase domain-containing protein [Phycisphaerales bacterium]